MPRPNLKAPHSFLERFVEVETRAAVLVVGAAVVGVLIASLPHGTAVLHHLETSHVRGLVAEIAVAAFFLLVGLELRREAATGGLSGAVARTAGIAALAGILLPAGIYLAMAPHGARMGWIAVIATDIAVASAVVSLGRGSDRARVILLTLAIFDDIGAVVALAIFGGGNPTFAWLPVIVGIIAAYAWLARRFRLGGVTAILTTAVVVLLAEHAGFHPSLAAFAVGYLVPREPSRRSEEPTDERIERQWHPWVAAVLLPLFVLTHTLVPVQLAVGSPASLILITMVAILVGKTVGVSGVLFVMRRAVALRLDEVLALGLAAAAALTVAVIGVEATLAHTRFAQPVSLGVLAATAIATVGGISVGRVAARRASRPSRAGARTTAPR